MAAASAVNRSLVWGSGSVYAWRVQITLKEKGLPYQSNRIDFGKGKNYRHISQQLTLIHQRRSTAWMLRAQAFIKWGTHVGPQAQNSTTHHVGRQCHVWASWHSSAVPRLKEIFQTQTFLFAGEHKSAEILAKNPRGQVSF